jgi:hypothetical protein
MFLINPKLFPYGLWFVSVILGLAETMFLTSDHVVRIRCGLMQRHAFLAYSTFMKWQKIDPLSGLITTIAEDEVIKKAIDSFPTVLQGHTEWPRVFPQTREDTKASPLLTPHQKWLLSMRSDDSRLSDPTIPAKFYLLVPNPESATPITVTPNPIVVMHASSSSLASSSSSSSSSSLSSSKAKGKLSPDAAALILALRDTPASGKRKSKASAPKKKAVTPKPKVKAEKKQQKSAKKNVKEGNEKKDRKPKKKDDDDDDTFVDEAEDDDDERTSTDESVRVSDDEEQDGEGDEQSEDDEVTDDSECTIPNGDMETETTNPEAYERVSTALSLLLLFVTFSSLLSS